MPVRIAVIYYSATGNVYDLARAIAEGAEAEGAEVRLRKVPELAPDTAIDANPAWHAHADATAFTSALTAPPTPPPPAAPDPRHSPPTTPKTHPPRLQPMQADSPCHC